MKTHQGKLDSQINGTAEEAKKEMADLSMETKNKAATRAFGLENALDRATCIGCKSVSTAEKVGFSNANCQRAVLSRVKSEDVMVHTFNRKISPPRAILNNRADYEGTADSLMKKSKIIHPHMHNTKEIQLETLNSSSLVDFHLFLASCQLPGNWRPQNSTTWSDPSSIMEGRERLVCCLDGAFVTCTTYPFLSVVCT